jgi:thymidylate kinase
MRSIMRHVILEGLDYTGKSTIAHWITTELRRRAMVCYVSETAASGIRLALRQQLVARALRSSATPTAQLAFFMSARALIPEELSLARRDDDLLVRDRCFLSTFAYQVWALLDREPRLDATTLFLLLASDDPSRYTETMVLYLDAPVETVLERMATYPNIGHERYRSRADLERTRAMYEDALALTREYLPHWRVERIDATQTLPTVQTEVLNRVSAWLFPTTE